MSADGYRLPRMKRPYFGGGGEQYPVGFGGGFPVGFGLRGAPRYPFPPRPMYARRAAAGLLAPRALFANPRFVHPAASTDGKYGFFDTQQPSSLPPGHVDEKRTGLKEFQKKEEKKQTGAEASSSTSKSATPTAVSMGTGKSAEPPAKKPAIASTVASSTPSAAASGSTVAAKQNGSAQTPTAAKTLAKGPIVKAPAQVPTPEKWKTTGSVVQNVTTKTSAPSPTASETLKGTNGVNTLTKEASTATTSASQTDSAIGVGHSGYAEVKRPIFSVDALNMNELFAKMVWKKLDSLKNPVRVSRLHGEIMTSLTAAIAEEADEMKAEADGKKKSAAK